MNGMDTCRSFQIVWYAYKNISVVKQSSTTNSLHTLHLDTGYWGDPSLDGKRYFLAAGLRVQHEGSADHVGSLLHSSRELRQDLLCPRKCSSSLIP